MLWQMKRPWTSTSRHRDSPLHCLALSHVGKWGHSSKQRLAHLQPDMSYLGSAVVPMYHLNVSSMEVDTVDASEVSLAVY